MKKFSCFIAALTCVFALSACGSEKGYSEIQQQRIDIAENIAVNYMLPALESFMSGYNSVDELSEYTMDEIAYQVGSAFSFNAEGFGFRTAAESFASAGDEIGGQIVDVGEPASTIDGTQIIVHIPVTGANGRTAEAEFVISNDTFATLESGALNTNYSFGEKMSKAALNTVIGMGTVFLMLILISLIISLFGKLAGGTGRKKKSVTETGIDKAVAQITEQETVESEAENLAGDTALVAVIAAAVAAYEGTASADGFVVRSIRKVKR